MAPTHDLMRQQLEKAMGLRGSYTADDALRSYLRTPAGYYAAQLLNESGERTIVLGCANYMEASYCAWLCKAGDAIADLTLISDLHKSEVYKVAKALGNVP